MVILGRARMEARVRKGIPFVGKWNERRRERGIGRVEFWFEFEQFLSSIEQFDTIRMILERYSYLDG